MTITSAPPSTDAPADPAALGNVPTDYRHHDRLVTPGENLVLPSACLKWYDLRRRDTEISAAVAADARHLLHAEATSGAFDVGYGLGLVVLHYSDVAAYLIVAVWRDNQELWATLYLRDLRRDDGFRRARPGVDAPTFCVWELAPIWHERQAWVRYLRSPRDEAAKRAYLADRLTGLV